MPLLAAAAKAGTVAAVSLPVADIAGALSLLSACHASVGTAPPTAAMAQEEDPDKRRTDTTGGATWDFSEDTAMKKIDANARSEQWGSLSYQNRLLMESAGSIDQTLIIHNDEGGRTGMAESNTHWNFGMLYNFRLDICDLCFDIIF